MSKNLIQRAMGATGPKTGLSAIVASVGQFAQSNGGTKLLPGVREGMALESLNEVELGNIGDGLNRLEHALEGFSKEAGFGTLSGVRRQAALAGAIAAGAPKTHVTAARPSMAVDEYNRFDVVDNGIERMQIAQEAYDDASNRNMSAYTVTYNMQAAQQDPFGEAFYPTVVVTRDQVGYMISIQLITVMNELYRKTDGSVNDFNRKNIVFALRDPSILRTVQTNIYPVVRAEAAQYFVDPALVPASTVDVDGEAVTTAPLKFGKSFSLIGISQVDSLVQKNLMDVTDAVDRDLHLKGVYMQIGGPTGPVIYFPTKDLFTANFVYNPQGSEKRVTLNFDNPSIQVTHGVKAVDGSDLTAAGGDLASIVDGMYVNLQFMVNGSCDLQTGTTNLLNGPVSVVSVTENDTKYLPGASNPAGIAAVFTALADATLIGFDLDGRRTNSNRRQRGDLLDVTVYNQCYSVPLLAPITAPRPLGQGDDTDTSDLNALITTTRIRASNGAVDELLRAQDVLARYAVGERNPADTVSIFGPARYLISPFYEEFDLDLGSVVDSLSSTARTEDIQQAIMNKAREMVFRMIRDSGWRQAAAALNGGNDIEPVVTLGTDQVIEGWLMTTGDMRTLGNGVDVKVVSTPNKLMNGKIVMTLTMPNAAEGVPNVLNFGNMAYQPELVLALPIHRNGANSKELTVQPAFRHITNLPIMAVINVTGWEAVVDEKVNINNHPV